MQIGILGLTFNSPNKGCEALSYSFLEIINSLAKKHGEKIDVNFLTPLPTKKIIKNKFDLSKIKKSYFPKKEYENIHINCCFYIYKNNKIIFLNNVKNCQYIFDFTAGDSFTDIYGKARFYDRTKMKQKIIDMNIPLILGSQTIGPFNDKEVCNVAVNVIKQAYEVYARDQMSYDYTLKISGRKAKLTTDIAFALPFESVELNTNKMKIGLNPSGLLWNGGYTKNNQFGLTVDYKEYCKTVIKNCLDKGYEVHLIPHAFQPYKGDEKNLETDLLPVDELKKEFPEVVIKNDFITAFDVKNYIAAMDVFIGARMHATIAACSSGVPVIPFSYSRKFEGLYESLNYPYLVSGCVNSTDEAITKTLEWIESKYMLAEKLGEINKILTEKTNYLVDEYEKILYKG